jgi:hypothetical protein
VGFSNHSGYRYLRFLLQPSENLTRYNLGSFKIVCNFSGTPDLDRYEPVSFVNREVPAAGIAPCTIFDWQRRYPQFAQAVVSARATVMLKLLRVVRRGCEKDPWLALDFLGRLYPQEYGRIGRRTRKATTDEGNSQNLKEKEEMIDALRRIGNVSG